MGVRAGAAGLLVLASTLVPAPVAAQTPPRVAVLSSLATATETGLPDPANSVRLVAARNEFESFQVVVHGGTTGLQRVALDVATPLASPDATIPAASVRIHRAAWYDVAGVASDSEGSLGRRADALIPAVDAFDAQPRNAFTHAGFRLDVAPDRNVVAWVDVHVPADQPTGSYDGSLRVTADGGFEATVSVRVDVVGVTLPSTPSFTVAIGATHGKACKGHHAGSDCPSADAHWQLLARYGRAALDNRVTVDNLAPGVPDSTAGRTRFRTHLLPLLMGTAPTRLAGARLGVFQLYGWCDAACVSAWRTEASVQGIADRFRYYDCDEAGTSSQRWTTCLDRIRAARTAWPGLPAAGTVTIQDTEAAGALDELDVLIPLVNHLHDKPGSFSRGGVFIGDQRPAYTSWLAAEPGREVWSYQACFSHGCEEYDRAGGRQLCAPYATTQDYWVGWPSLVIDTPPSQQRATGWLGARYATTGHYYYESLFSYWQTGGITGPSRTDPWTSSYCYGGHGDGTLFYPGTPAKVGGTTHVPIESIRLKRVRDGVEDAELLRLAADAGHAAAAKDIATRLVPTAYATTFSQSAVDAARLEVLALLGALPPAPHLALERISGADRYATAAAAARATFSSATVAVIARGDLFPDALAGSYLAGTLAAPILLSRPGDVPAATLQALRDLGVVEVRLLGGTAALSEAVAQQLRDAGLAVVRIAGSDRYDTARRVALAGGTGGSFGTAGRTAILASGENFPDALAAGGVAFGRGFPLLLTRRQALPPSVTTALTSLGIETVLVVGGTAAVDELVLDDLRSRGFAVRRLSGDTRYGTATAIGNFAIDELAFDPGVVVIARGDGFADALAGGPFAGVRNAAIALTPPDQPDASTCAFLAGPDDGFRPGPRSGYVLGGAAAVSTGTELALEGCGTDDTPPDVDPPTDVRAGTTEPTTVALAWGAGPGATEQAVYRATGSCPATVTGYTRLAVLAADAQAHTDRGLLPSTTYCYLVTSIAGDIETGVTADTTVLVTTPASTRPTSLAIDVSDDGDGVLDPGDTIVVRFDARPEPAGGDQVWVIDPAGDEVRLQCGTSVTCTVSDRTLTMAVTSAPSLIASRDDGLVQLGSWAAVTFANLGNAAGAWNVAASGLAANEIVLGTTNPTNAVLHRPLATADVYTDLVRDEVTVIDQDCDPLRGFDQVRVYSIDGTRLGLADAAGTGVCRATVSATISDGDRLILLYRRSGPFTPSRSVLVTATDRPPPAAVRPVSFDVDLSGDTDGVLGSGDTITARFDELVDPAVGDVVWVIDTAGDEARLTCGGNATCTTGGTTLTLALTAPVELLASRGDGVVQTGGGVTISFSTIGNSAGRWDLAASGLAAKERVFGSTDPTNAAVLHAAVPVADVSTDAAADTVTVTDADCTPLKGYDQLQVFAADGTQLGVADVADPGGGACSVTVATGGFAAGDTLRLLYRRAGPFTHSLTTAVTAS